MSLLNIEDSLVLVIDVQEKLLKAIFNSEEVEKRSGVVIDAAKILGIPIVVSEQYPSGLGSSVDKTLSEYAKIYEKNTFSALEANEIFEAIKKSGKKQVVIFGIETHICVNQTVQTLRKFNVDVFVVKDACGSRTLDNHVAGIDRMAHHGAEIVTSEIVLFEWLKTASHPKFKEIQALIK